MRVLEIDKWWSESNASERDHLHVPCGHITTSWHTCIHVRTPTYEQHQLQDGQGFRGMNLTCIDPCICKCKRSFASGLGICIAFASVVQHARTSVLLSSFFLETRRTELPRYSQSLASHIYLPEGYLHLACLITT